MTTPAVETPISKSSAVVQSDQNVKSIEDKFGSQTTRSGQTVDLNFTDAVIASYSNLTHAPILCAIFFSLLAITLAEYLETTAGPLEKLRDALYDVLKADKNKMITTLTRLLLMLVKFVISQKDWLLNVMLISVPYFRKPSSKNLKITVVFSVLAVVFDSSPFIILLFSQAWFLITELRNPKFKMVVSLIMALIFLLSWVDVAQTSTTKDQKTDNKTTPAVNTSSDTPAAPAKRSVDSVLDPLLVEYNDSPFLQAHYTLQQYKSYTPLQRKSIKKEFSFEKFKGLTLDNQLAVLEAGEFDPKHLDAALRMVYSAIYKKEPVNMDREAIYLDLMTHFRKT